MWEEASLDIVLQLKASSAALMLVSALMLFTSRMPVRARLGFGLFFLLVGINSGLEAFRWGRLETLTSYDPWRGIAIVVAAFDPFVLVYAMSVYPKENALHRGWVLALFLFGAAVLALTAPFQATEALTSHRLALAVYTAVAYSLVAVTAARHLLRRGSGAPGVLFPALALATIPAIGRVAVAAGYHLSANGATVATHYLVLTIPFWLALASVAAGAALLASRRWHPSLGVGILLAGVVLLPLDGAHGLRELLFGLGISREASVGLVALGSAALEPRWVVITLLVVAAAHRGDALAMTPRQRERWSRAVLATAALLLGVPLLLAAQEAIFGVPARGLGPIELALVVAALTFTPPTQRAATWVAQKLFGAPGRDAASAERFYGSAVAATYASGRADDVAYLRELRDELGISGVRSEQILMDVRRARPQGFGVGAIVAERYRIDALLRRGGVGRALRATDLLLSRTVVVKEVPLDETMEADAVLREARTLGRVSHPNVVQIHDALVTPDAVLLVMEHVERGSLQEVVRTAARVDPQEGIPLLLGVLGGLEAVHAAGIVHRDVKPANVLVAADGTPKLADFGLARWTESPTMQTQGVVHGTPGYIAPEVLAGERPTAAADLYAVARIALLHVDLPQTPGIEAWLAKGLAAYPAARHASAAEMAAALREAAAAAPHAAEGASEARPRVVEHSGHPVGS